MARYYYSNIDLNRYKFKEILKGNSISFLYECVEGLMRNEQESNEDEGKLFLDFYEAIKNEAKRITENLGYHLKRK